MTFFLAYFFKVTTLADSRLKSHKKLVWVSYSISAIKYSDKSNREVSGYSPSLWGRQGCRNRSNWPHPSIITEHMGKNEYRCACAGLTSTLPQSRNSCLGNGASHSRQVFWIQLLAPHSYDHTPSWSRQLLSDILPGCHRLRQLEN